MKRIFVTVGSQKMPFNRLIEYVNNLKDDLSESIVCFIQTGVSNYIPKKVEYKDYLTFEEFNSKMLECDILITHGGTGAIVKGLKEKKRIIAVPRLQCYSEHVDNHQLEIVTELTNLGYILSANTYKELLEAIQKIDTIELREFQSNTKTYEDFFSNYLREQLNVQK